MSTLTPNALSGSSPSRVWLTLLCVFSAVLLFALRANVMSNMSIQFAGQVAVGNWYFFSHHLFYQPIVRIFAAVFEPLGCDIMCAGQLHSIGWSVAAIASTYIIALHLTRSVATSVGASLLLLVMHGFWVYATQLEPYAPLIGITAVIAAILLVREPGQLSTGEIVAVTALFTLSLFFHQANIFLLVPIAAYLYMTAGRSGLWSAAKITAAAGAISFSVNVIVFWSTHPGKSVGEFYGWLTYYGAVSSAYHGAWSDVLSLDISRIANAMHSTVAAFVTVPAEAIEANIHKPLMYVVAPCLAAILLWNVARSWRLWPDSVGRIFLILWWLAFALFGYWWHAGTYKFYLVLTTPTAILAAIMVRDMVSLPTLGPFGKKTFVAGASAIVLGIALLNFVSSIWPTTRSDHNRYALAEILHKATPDDCSIYAERRFSGKLLYRYGREVRPVNLMYKKVYFSSVNPDVARAIPHTTDFEMESCAVILLFWLSEQYRESRAKSDLGSRITSADSHLKQDDGANWQDYIEWLLDVRDVEGGVSHSDYRLFRIEGADDTFVYIDRTRRRAVPSVEVLLREIRDDVSSNPLGSFANYRTQSVKFVRRVFGYGG